MRLLWPGLFTKEATAQFLWKAGLLELSEQYSSSEVASGYRIPILVDPRGNVVRELHEFLYEKMYFSDGYKTEKTVKTYAECIVSWMQFAYLSNLDWRDATQRSFSMYRNFMKGTSVDIETKPLSARTINLRLTAVVEFYKFYWTKLSLLGPVEKEMFDLKLQRLTKVRLKVKSYSRKPRAITTLGCRALMRSLQGVHRVIFAWTLITGLRVSSVLSISVKDFRLLVGANADVFLKVYAKGGKELDVYVPNSLIQETVNYISIDRNLNLRPNKHSRVELQELFISKSGRPVGYSCYYAAFRRACKSLGMDAHPHQARTTFATFMSNKISKVEGLDSIKIVQGLLGHSSADTTQDYLEKIGTSNLDVMTLIDQISHDMGIVN